MDSLGTTLNNDHTHARMHARLSRDFLGVTSVTQTNRLISIELEIVKHQLMSKCESIARSSETPTIEPAELKHIFLDLGKILSFFQVT